MYKSPIDVIQGEMQMQVEGEIFRAVQNVGVYVDKEELIKALAYDRNQYAKGHDDGYAEAIQAFVNMAWEYLGDKYIDWECRKIIIEFAESLKEGGRDD